MSENINKQSFDTYEESSENNILDVDQEVLASEEASEEEQLEEKESDAVNCVSKPIDPVQEIRIIEEKLGFKERMKLIFSHHLINRICVLVLAIVLLSLAFAPTICCEIQLDGDDQYVYFSGIDVIKMTGVVSLIEKESVSLDKEEFLSEMDSFDEEELNQAMLSVASIKLRLTTSVVMAAFAYVLYLALCLALMIVSIKNLISEYLRFRRNIPQYKKYGSDTLVPFVFCMLPAVSFLLIQACRVYVANVIIDSEAILVGVKLSWGMVLTVVLLVLGSVFTCVTRSLRNPGVNIRYFDRRRLRHTVCMVLALFVLLLSFLPSISIVSEDYDEAAGVNMWDIREVTWEERKAVRESSVEIDEDLVDEVFDDEITGEAFINALLFTSSISNVRTLYLVMEIFSAITLLSLGALLFSMIRRGFLGFEGLRSVKFWKAITVICALANLIIVIIMQNALNNCLPSELASFVEFGVGKGTLWSFLGVMLIVFLRLRNVAEREEDKDDYDNADISYAPYVLYSKN